MADTSESDRQREPQVVALHAGEGRDMTFYGGTQATTIKLTGEDSLGRLGIYEIAMQPKTNGASPHYHKDMVEIFYVLEGEIVVYAGDKSYPCRAGSIVSIPPNTVHGWINPGDKVCRFLLLFTHDRNREAYFRQVAELTKTGTQDLEARKRLDEVNDTFRVPGVKFG